MFAFGWMELLFILMIVLIVFGAGKLPQLGEGIGKAVKGFKRTVHEPDAGAVQPTPAQDDRPAGRIPVDAVGANAEKPLPPVE